MKLESVRPQGPRGSITGEQEEAAPTWSSGLEKLCQINSLMLSLGGMLEKSKFGGSLLYRGQITRAGRCIQGGLDRQWHKIGAVNVGESRCPCIWHAAVLSCLLEVYRQSRLSVWLVSRDLSPTQ